MEENFGGGVEKGVGGNRCMSLDPMKNRKKCWWVDKCNEGYYCHQCDRRFKSPKALFGHMGSHSRKKVGFVEESFKIQNSGSKKKKRSSLPMRFNNNFSKFNFSNVDEDVLDVATCLLTLANGSAFYTYHDDHHKSLFVSPDLPREITNDDDDCDLESGCLSFVEEMEEPNSCSGKNTVGYGLKKDGIEMPFVKDIEVVDDKMNTSSTNGGDKVYQCSVCFKVFTSGQALGGHKRAHFLTNSKSKQKDFAQHLGLNVHVGATTCLGPTHSTDLDSPQPVLELEHLVPSV